jgi:hypothetical protein
MKSWRTTILGIVTILGAVAGVLKALLDGDPSTNPDFITTVAAITAGWGLIAARDQAQHIIDG